MVEEMALTIMNGSIWDFIDMKDIAQILFKDTD